jgi:hypothetical protein
MQKYFVRQDIVDGGLEWPFHTYIKMLGAICILPCTKTFVKRQAYEIRRQFITSDRIRKGYITLTKCPSTKKPRQLLHRRSNQFKQLHHTKCWRSMPTFCTHPLQALMESIFGTET